MYNTLKKRIIILTKLLTKPLYNFIKFFKIFENFLKILENFSKYFLNNVNNFNTLVSNSSYLSKCYTSFQ